MTTQLAAKLMPYFSYFLYAQLLLLCFAVLVGCILMIKRLMARPTYEGDPNFDYDKIADEIDSEVKRLEQLRNRLVPASTGRFARNEASAPTVTGDQLDALVEQRYKDKFADLKNELQRSAAEATLIQSANGGTEPNHVPAAEVDGLKNKIQALEAQLQAEKTRAPVEAANPAASAEVESLKKAHQEAADKVSHLEKIVSEFEIFEEDLAHVKRFKAENEELRQKLSMTGQAPATENVKVIAATPTEAVETKTFKADPVEATPVQVIKGDAVEATPVQVIKGDVPAPKEAAPVVPSSPDVTEEDIANMFKELSAEQGPTSIMPPAPAAPIAAAPVTPAPPANPPGFEVDKVVDGPAVTASPEDREAMAEAAGGDDRLMAEFEKLLGGENKSS